VGKENGKRNWVIDCDGNLVDLVSKADLSRNQLIHICGGETWLGQKYPRFRNGKPVNGFANDLASRDLIEACRIMGAWHTEGPCRGAGSWAGADSDLIMHRGNLVYLGKSVARPNRYGDFVYEPKPALPNLPPPDHPSVATAAKDTLDRLDTILFERGAF